MEDLHGPERLQRVLIIDDDPRNIQFLQTCLGDEAFETLGVSDPFAALAQAEVLQPDLILLDVVMPGLDGFEICARLKAREATADIPVIFLTSSYDVSHKVRGFEAGAVDYVTKPFQTDELLARVRRQLQLHRLHERLEAQNQRLQAEIAERRRTEAALQDSERKLRLIAESTTELILAYDMRQRLLYVNPAVETLTGYSVEELHERQFIHWIHPEDSARMLGLWGKLFEGQGFVAEPFRLITKDGRLRWCLSSWGPLFDEAGVQVGVHGTERDITELKQAVEDLREAKEAAEAANRAKSVFLASMSHELRTPLNAILGYTQILRLGADLHEQQLAALETIDRSGRHLLTLINDILDLAQIEARKLTLVPAPVSVARLVADAMDTMRAHAEQKGLRFQHDLVPEPGATVLVDGRRLQQVLLNLLGNAVKFTESGRVSLRVLVLPSPPSCRVRFQVEDTGIGMGPEELGQIFRPFQRAGGSARHIDGVGLGLTISQNLVGMMGGRIQVQSLPGQGSIFWFELELPLVGSDEEEAEPAAAAAAAERDCERLEPPPPEEIEALHALTLEGNMRRVAERSRRLELEGGASRRFAQKLRLLAEDFEDEKILSLLAPFRENAP